MKLKNLLIGLALLGTVGGVMAEDSYSFFKQSVSYGLTGLTKSNVVSVSWDGAINFPYDNISLTSTPSDTGITIEMTTTNKELADCLKIRKRGMGLFIFTRTDSVNPFKFYNGDGNDVTDCKKFASLTIK